MPLVPYPPDPLNVWRSRGPSRTRRVQRRRLRYPPKSMASSRTMAPERMMSTRSALSPLILRRFRGGKPSSRSRIAVMSDCRIFKPWRCLRSPECARRWMLARVRTVPPTPTMPSPPPPPPHARPSPRRRQCAPELPAHLSAEGLDLARPRPLMLQEERGGPHRAQGETRDRDDLSIAHPAQLEARASQVRHHAVLEG